MEVLAHLESGEAKLLGVMVENLAKDVTRVEGGVNDINRKMDILTRIDLTMQGFTKGLLDANSAITSLDDRVDQLETHRDGLVKVEDAKRWATGTWIGVLGVLAGLGLVAADIFGLFHHG